MNRLVLIGLAPLVLAGPALAQTMDHSATPGMPPAQDPHAGHDMPAAAPMAPSAMPGMDMNAPAPSGATIGDLDIPTSPPPAPPGDHAADRLFPPAAMAAARDQLRREHGGAGGSMIMANIAEWSPRSGQDSYRWDGEAWFGGDLNRLVLKSEGAGVSGEGVEHAEVQALYARAVGPYFNLQAGMRHDFEPKPGRTYATIGFEGLAPYWFEVEGATFLSNKGDLSARLGGSYDLRITQRLILQPRAEFNLAATSDAATGVGSGLSDAELGLRLRYEIRRAFAPYVGVTHDRKFGKTADHARAAGEDVEDTRLVLGVRAWF